MARLQKVVWCVVGRKKIIRFLEGPGTRRWEESGELNILLKKRGSHSQLSFQGKAGPATWRVRFHDNQLSGAAVRFNIFAKRDNSAKGYLRRWGRK